MSTYKRGHVYWYKFAFKGLEVRESTKQGNDKTARAMESAHRTRLAGQDKAEDEAKARLGCEEVLVCHECEKLFNADKVLKTGENISAVQGVRVSGVERVPCRLLAFLDDRFMPDMATTHKAKPNTVLYYRQSAAMLNRQVSPTFGRTSLQANTSVDSRLRTKPFPPLESTWACGHYGGH